MLRAHVRHYDATDGTWFESTSPWGLPHRALVSCADGKRRIARMSREADTWFSVPARVSVKGKTVTGFVTMNDAGVGYEFIAYSTGKNGHLLPQPSSADKARGWS